MLINFWPIHAGLHKTFLFIVNSEAKIINFSPTAWTEQNYLEYFQKHFVLVPTDKASNNVLIVCKEYYLDVT